MEKLGTTNAPMESSSAQSFGHGPFHTATCPQLHHSLLVDQFEISMACGSLIQTRVGRGCGVGRPRT